MAPKGRVFHAPLLRRTLMTGETIRIVKVTGRCFICRVMAVHHLSELADDDRAEWAGFAAECVLQVRWFAVVGDDTALFRTPQWNKGKFHRSIGLKEVVLRDSSSDSLIGDLAVEGFVTVWPGEDVQSREVRVPLHLHAHITHKHKLHETQIA